MAIETPRYKTIDSEGNFEVREYATHLVAETLVDGDFDQASTLGFRRLAGYIFGANTARQKIAMTAPVSLEKKSEKIAMTAPVSQESRNGKYLITFNMPASYSLDTLPVPNDAEVKLATVPARTCAALKFSGLWSEAKYQAELDQLNQWMNAKKLEKSGEPIFARYNPPWTPWFLRKNEILIPLKIEN